MTDGQLARWRSIDLTNGEPLAVTPTLESSSDDHDRFRVELPISARRLLVKLTVTH